MKRKKKKRVVGKVLKKIVREKRTCYFCGTSENMTRHHIIFRFAGGDRLENNQVDMCESCHRKFHALAQPMINLFLQTIQRLQPKPTRKIGFIRPNEKKGGKKK